MFLVVIWEVTASFLPILKIGLFNFFLFVAILYILYLFQYHLLKNAFHFCELYLNRARKENLFPSYLL